MAHSCWPKDDRRGDTSQEMQLALEAENNLPPTVTQEKGPVRALPEPEETWLQVMATASTKNASCQSLDNNLANPRRENQLGHTAYRTQDNWVLLKPLHLF